MPKSSSAALAKARMAATLGIDEYLHCYLLKTNDSQAADDKTAQDAKSTHQQHQRLLLATVYKTGGEGLEEVIYSRKIAPQKNVDPVSEFVRDMTGSAGNASNGPAGLKRTGSLRDMNGGEGDDRLPRNCSVNVEILASRSPSNVGSEELLRLLDFCKRNAIKISIHFTFAHPYSWDNKYNKEGLQSLHEKGIKLKPLSLQQGLNLMLNDVRDNLETLDELQTSRGTILINYDMLKRAASKFRDSINVKSDFYFQDSHERLNEIFGFQNRIEAHSSTVGDATTFSIATYRDYFLLQNSDEIWAKLKVDLSKTADGVSQDQQLLARVYNVPAPKAARHGKNSDPLNPKTQLQPLTDKIWRLVGENVTLGELVERDEILVSITAVLSEYPDRMDWQATVRALHEKLERKLTEAGLDKVHIETRIRYAMNLSEESEPGSKLNGTDGVQVTTECIHIRDMLFDMLEDLEDNVNRLESVDFGRGANIRVDKGSVSSAMGLLNKAIRIRAADGKEHSMNSDFKDGYSDA